MSHFHGLVNSDVYGSRILITMPTSLSHVRGTVCVARIYGRRVRCTHFIFNTIRTYVHADACTRAQCRVIIINLQLYASSIYKIIFYTCKGGFNPNIPIFAPNSAKGLHFSAFHFFKATGV